jgi:predicted DNA-binding transcriptional regulator AlpA
MTTTTGGGSMPPAEKLAYTIPELSQTSGISRSKIYEEMAAGRLESRFAGKRRLVLRDAAIAWLGALPRAPSL